MGFDQLGLAPELLRAITEQGYETPTPIQSQAIPLVIQGKDLKACAQTGTGKTAAFTLPLLQRLLPLASTSASPARHPVRAVILAPTRELAIQVHENLAGYAKHTPFRTTIVYGGTDIKPQILELRKGVEFLVATPGRFLDLYEQKALNLSSVDAIVLDEADRMLDMGFIPDVQRILNLLPAKRQSLLFSATFSNEIQRLADTMLRDPVMVEVARRNAVSETITHRVHPVSEWDKQALLVDLLRSGQVSQTLVFVRTKQNCSQLSRALQRAGLKADAIHGDKTQLERIKALDAFKAGELQALVATDVAARGIDIEELPYVINYELPNVPEDYVHRIGRTGRAGHEGNALSLVCADETWHLAEIEKLIKKPIEQVRVAGYEPESHWEYPPTGKKRRGRSSDREGKEGRDGERRETRPPREREARKPEERHSGERSERAERPERGERPAGRERRRQDGQGERERNWSPRAGSSYARFAADGFDFSKPYEPANPAPETPHISPEQGTVAKSGMTSGIGGLHKPRRIVPALLGGLGRKAD